LTHNSCAREEGDLASGNERLEFLGDAVLGLIVAELLITAHPDRPEGSLTRARAQAVNQGALAERARSLGLGELVRLGRGERRHGGSEKPSILANAFEAVLGALYLDAGFEPARAFVAREFGAELARASGAPADAKTRLQEALHAAGASPPVYVTVGESGPAHAREFAVEVSAGERVCGKGTGRSKQAAEQAAAEDSLRQLSSEPA
jgi:ribonuclease III